MSLCFRNKIVLTFIWLGLPGSLCLAQENSSVRINAMEVVSGEEATSTEMFGWRSGYVHPYLSLRGEYTDNLYNINIDEKDNFLTVIAPGIWFGLPRTKDIPVDISHHNEAIGGRRFSIPGSGSYDRAQLYFLGGLDYKSYSIDSDLNYTAWHLEGMVQYKMPAGLSFRLMDRFTHDRDRFDLGSFAPQDFSIADGEVYISSAPSMIRDYSSNQADLSVNLDMGKRFAALFNYTNFYLDYDATDDWWLDRTDNRFSLSVAYHHSAKTSVFIEYSHAFITYETDTSNDSENQFIYGGINWKGSAKSSLAAKGGYQVKQYDTFGLDDVATFSMEAHFNYLVTDKTKISLQLYKALEETDSLANRGRDTTVAKFRYDQQFTYRTRGYCEFWYEYNDYDEFTRLAGTLAEEDARKDTRFMVKPAFQYHFRDWLMAELAYSFENRNSNANLYDFTTQTVFLTLNASL